MIKIGCNYLSLTNTSVEDFIRTVYDLRLDIVDFHQQAFTSTDPEYLARIKLQCLEYGLPIGYIGVSGVFTGTAAERQEHAERCREAIDLAAFLGSPIIRVFCSTMPEKNGDGDDPWPAMIRGYQEVADYAATKGIAVGLQNHPSTADEMLRIRSETGRDNFSFIMDTGPWIGAPGLPEEATPEDLCRYRFMEQTAPYALYIRTKFYKVDSGVEERLDYERIVRIIKEVDFNGCLSIVYEGQAEDRVDQVRKAASHLRELLAGD